MNKKKCIVAFCCAIALMLGITSGMSFAYWRQTLVQTETNELSTGCFNISLTEEQNEISLAKAYPISDESGRDLTPYTFKLTNTCDTAADYTLGLEMISGTTLNTKFVDVLINDGNIKKLNTLTQLEVVDNTSVESRVVDTGTLNANESKDFSLRLWLDKDVTVEDNAQNKVLKAKVVVTAEATIIANNPKCKKATTLHTEVCNSTSSSYYCSSVGYTTGSDITYGTLISGDLKAGDALDCDVNGDGVYDSETERFYYLRDIDSETSALLYYINTKEGVPNGINEATISYSASGSTFNGPSVAVTYLPTTTQWSNVTLKTITKDIVATTTTVPAFTGFSYSGYAARLLSYDDVSAACGVTKISTTSNTLKDCQFLFENTFFKGFSYTDIEGYWLEDIWGLGGGWSIDGLEKRFYSPDLTNGTRVGVRPVIEVSKSDIEI